MSRRVDEMRWWPLDGWPAEMGTDGAILGVRVWNTGPVRPAAGMATGLDITWRSVQGDSLPRSLVGRDVDGYLFRSAIVGPVWERVRE